MTLIDLILTAIALSMDAFAVAISKGLSGRSYRLRNSLITGLYFGGFQALMPLLGYCLAGLFAEHIRSFDHWIAFGLLALIGGNMIRESLSGEEEQLDASFGLRRCCPWRWLPALMRWPPVSPLRWWMPISGQRSDSLARSPSCFPVWV